MTLAPPARDLGVYRLPDQTSARRDACEGCGREFIVTVRLAAVDGGLAEWLPETRTCADCRAPRLPFDEAGR